jgi:RHS repeat-associated protein
VRADTHPLSRERRSRTPSPWRFGASTTSAEELRTGIVTDRALLMERYEYTPYGNRKVFSHGWMLADMNDNDQVDIADLGEVGTHWQESVPAGDEHLGRVDVVGDGLIDISDLSAVGSSWQVKLAPADTPVLHPTNDSYRRGYDCFGPSPGAPLCEFGHQGLMHDEEWGIVDNRVRGLHPGFERFMGRDRVRYVDGMSLYQYSLSTPVNLLDCWGEEPLCWKNAGWTLEYQMTGRRGTPPKTWNKDQLDKIEASLAALCPTTTCKYAGSEQECSPSACLEQSRAIAQAIVDGIESHKNQAGCQTGGNLGNLANILSAIPELWGGKQWNCLKFNLECDGWQDLVDSAARPVIDAQKAKKNNCFQPTRVTGFRDPWVHNWNEIRTPNGSVVIDAWPTGGNGDLLQPGTPARFPNGPDGKPRKPDAPPKWCCKE